MEVVRSGRWMDEERYLRLQKRECLGCEDCRGACLLYVELFGMTDIPQLQNRASA